MTATEIFEVMLRDPLLREKYQLTEDQIENLKLHQPSEIDIVELIKILINGVENNTPDKSINSQVCTYFKI